MTGACRPQLLPRPPWRSPRPLPRGLTFAVLSDKACSNSMPPISRMDLVRLLLMGGTCDNKSMDTWARNVTNSRFFPSRVAHTEQNRTTTRHVSVGSCVGTDSIIMTTFTIFQHVSLIMCQCRPADSPTSGTRRGWVIFKMRPRLKKVMSQFESK